MLTHCCGRSPLVVVVAATSVVLLVYMSFRESSVTTILVEDHPLKFIDSTSNQEASISGSSSSSSSAAVKMQPSKMENADLPPSEGIKSQVPVIGVLTQVLRDYKRFSSEHHLHLASSYVKWIESAGAQVLPILLNENDAYYERVFNQTNGLLFPGGDNLLDPNKSTPMMMAAKKLYKLALGANQRGDHYPIWGTCLGLELLSVLSSGRNELDSCQSIDTPLNMSFVQRGKLFEPNQNANLAVLNDLDYSKFIMDTLKRQAVTYNYHRKCLTDAGLKRAGLEDFYRPLAYSQDKDGFKFVAIFEALDYPFFGVQFHPEKPPFEFTLGKSHLNVPHSRESIEVSRYFADFFVRQAQLNRHRPQADQIQMELIYAYEPMYTAPLRDLYEQRYLFPFSDANNWKNELEILRDTPQGTPLIRRDKRHMYLPDGVSPVKNQYLMIEFLEHIPHKDEVIPEEVRKGPDEMEMRVISGNGKAAGELGNDDEPDMLELPKESDVRDKKKRNKLWF